MTEKVVNYTEAQTAELVQAYTAVNTQDEREAVIAEYADSFGKVVASIRAKLGSEGVYVNKTKAPGKAKRVRKSVRVTAIAEALGVEEEVVESLEKATAKALELVQNALETETA